MNLHCKCGVKIAEIDRNGKIHTEDNYCQCVECEEEMCLECHGEGRDCKECESNP